MNDDVTANRQETAKAVANLQRTKKVIERNRHRWSILFGIPCLAALMYLFNVSLLSATPVNSIDFQVLVYGALALVTGSILAHAVFRYFQLFVQLRRN